MIKIDPIAIVENKIVSDFEGPWAEIESKIILNKNIDPSALLGLSEFSHVEVIFYFDKLDVNKVCRSARHPKDNSNWPLTGILAQRGSLRPNLIGATIAKLIHCADDYVLVQGLDAFNGTPVLDIKPVMKEFLPTSEIRQAQWSIELMKNYF